MTEKQDKVSKKAIAAGLGLSVLRSALRLVGGHIGDEAYSRRPLPPWPFDEARPVLLTGLCVYDPRTGSRSPGGVLMCGERIAAVLSAHEALEAARDPRNAVLDYQGNDAAEMTLLPGLVDLHAHMTLPGEVSERRPLVELHDAQRQKNFEECLLSGVTTVRDMGASPEVLDPLIEEVEARRLLGPRVIKAAGALVAPHGMWDMGPVKNVVKEALLGPGWFHFPRSEAEARAAVRKLHGQGARLIKIYMDEKPLYGADRPLAVFSKEELFAIHDEAERLELPVASHCMFTQAHDMSVSSGVRSVEHLPVDGPIDLVQARILASQKAVVVPTLMLGLLMTVRKAGDPFSDTNDAELFRQVRKRYVTEKLSRLLLPGLYEPARHLESLLQAEMPRSYGMMGALHGHRMLGYSAWARTSIEALREAGVTLGVGSDGGLALSFPGQVSLECQLLHAMGISEAEVLRMVTLGNIEILGEAQDRGSVEPGKIADLVVVRGDPLADLSALDKVVSVFQAGRRRAHDGSVANE